MAACFLQGLGPVNVVFLVKTGLQLHQHKDLLAPVRRLCQGSHNGGVAADAVQSLLDSQYLRISGSRLHEIYHRIKGLVRMVEQNISFADVGKNVVFIHKRRVGLGHISGGLQMIKSGQAVHLHKKRQIQRAVDGENIAGMDIQLLFQTFQKPLVCIFFDLQTDSFAPSAFFQLFLYFF